MWTIIFNGGEITLVNQKEGRGAIEAEKFCLLSEIAQQWPILRKQSILQVVVMLVYIKGHPMYCKVKQEIAHASR